MRLDAASKVPKMRIDTTPDQDLSPQLPGFAALRHALDAQNTPAAVEESLMAAFATRFPPKRWYHSFSPRQWSIGAGGTALMALMLTLALQPAALIAPAGEATISGVDEGSPFIALESVERIEQEINPRVLEADLPGTILAALGLPVSPETAGDSVRAEMLVGADGSPLALRLVAFP